MDAKDLRTEPALSDRSNDGNSKYPQGSGVLQCNRNKPYQDIGPNSVAKVDVQTARPCAVIGPDRVVPPSSNVDSYLKKGPVDPWPGAEATYRRPPEYPHKLPDYNHPNRNISPRQTFQENMQRIMVPPSYSAVKLKEDHHFPMEANTQLRNTKVNVPTTEAKYCEVPYPVNSITNDQKIPRNADISVPNMNPTIVRSAIHAWPPNNANVRPTKPYGASELYQYPEYQNCTGPRPMVVQRTHRVAHEDPGHVYPDAYYHEGGVRFKPYPTVKERYPQARYEYLNNYSNTFQQAPFPPHKYDLQKTIPSQPYSGYAQVPLKYMDTRMADPIMNGYQRPLNPSNFNTVPYRSQMIHPSYGPISGNCLQPNKFYTYQPDNPIKSMAPNKLPYEVNHKMYSGEYENPRNMRNPMPEGFYVNEMARPHPLKSQMLATNYPSVNMHTMPHAYYRRDNPSFKNYEHGPPFRNIDPSGLSGNNLSRLPTQFSPNTISPSDSNTSNDTMQNQSQDDCGYVSQSSSASIRSTDSGFNRLPHELYRRYDYRYGPILKNSHLISKSDYNSSADSKNNKKDIDVRQFLQMWNESEEEGGESSNKEITLLANSSNELANRYETNSQEQLYVLGLVNVPSEELGKYEHIQKVSKLPENIKGYNSIELLNQFEEVTSNLNNYNVKHSRDYHVSLKNSMPMQPMSMSSRPLSPLDVEAKISQSVIHKEVGCNFEIKPCSPKMLNVEVAAPIQTVLGERAIEKVTNPLIMPPSMMHSINDTSCNAGKNQDRKVNLNLNSKVPSCKMINTQYSNSDAVDSIKTNYSLQDLESSSGVCLASLPRLDNDIELSFPEVNQQFINANKVESVITTITKDLPALDAGQPDLLVDRNTKDVENSNSSSNMEFEKEFPKLSKYRKLKRKGTDNKEIILGSNAQAMRTDSVIIKNPENMKLHDGSPDPYVSLKNVAQIDQQDPINLTVNLDNQLSHAEVLKDAKEDMAIDFSINSGDHFSMRNQDHIILKDNVAHAVSPTENFNTICELAPITNPSNYDENASYTPSSNARSDKNMSCPSWEIHENSIENSNLSNDEVKSTSKSDAEITEHSCAEPENPSRELNKEKLVSESCKYIENPIAVNPKQNLTSKKLTSNFDGNYEIKQATDIYHPINCEKKEIFINEENITAHSKLISKLHRKDNDMHDVDAKVYHYEQCETSNDNERESSRERVHCDVDDRLIELNNETQLVLDARSPLNKSCLKEEFNNENNVITKNSLKHLRDYELLNEKRRKGTNSESTETSKLAVVHKSKILHKELFSPFIQKLLANNEGYTKLTVKAMNESVIETKRGIYDNEKIIINEDIDKLMMPVEDNSSCNETKNYDADGETNIKKEDINNQDSVDLIHGKDILSDLILKERSLNEISRRTETSEDFADDTDHLKNDTHINITNKIKINDEFNETNNTKDPVISLSESKTISIAAELHFIENENKINDSVEAISNLQPHLELVDDHKEGIQNSKISHMESALKYESTEKNLEVSKNDDNSETQLFDQSTIIATSAWNNENGNVIEDKQKRDEPASELMSSKTSIADITLEDTETVDLTKHQGENYRPPINFNKVVDNFEMQLLENSTKTSILASNNRNDSIEGTKQLHNTSDFKIMLTKELDDNITLDNTENTLKSEGSSHNTTDQEIKLTESETGLDHPCTGDLKHNPKYNVFISNSSELINIKTKNERNLTKIDDFSPTDSNKELIQKPFEMAGDDQHNFEDPNYEFSNYNSISMTTKLDTVHPEQNEYRSKSLNENIKKNVNSTALNDTSASFCKNNIELNNASITSEITLTDIVEDGGNYLESKTEENTDGNDINCRSQKPDLEIINNVSVTGATAEDANISHGKDSLISTVVTNLESTHDITDENENTEVREENWADSGEGLNIENKTNCSEIQLTNKAKDDEPLKDRANTDNDCEIKSEEDVVSESEKVICNSVNVEVDNVNNDEIEVDLKINDVSHRTPADTICDTELSNGAKSNELTEKTYILDSNMCSKMDSNHIILQSQTAYDENKDCISQIKTKDWQTRDNIRVKKRKLKRSLSESALDLCNTDLDGNIKQDDSLNCSYLWPNKRKKIMEPDDIEHQIITENYCNIIHHNINRRNSISSVYNDENVYILIDNNCIITDDCDDTEKICFTDIPEECLPGIHNDIDSAEEIEEITENESEIITLQQSINYEYSDTCAPDGDSAEEKVLEESWVEDVACVETVVSEDIAEDIIVSASSSPRDTDLSDIESNNEENIFDENDYTDKVKYIYGDKMCSDDAHLVETLYRTPQMDVNKTLVYRESQVNEDCSRYYDKESLEKVLSESNTSENANAILNDGTFNTNKENTFCSLANLALLKPDDNESNGLGLENKYLQVDSDSDIFNNQDDVVKDISQNKLLITQDDTVHSCESSVDNVISYNHQESPQCVNSSSPEVSSTTSEEKSSGILLKITNYGGSRTAQVNNVNPDRNYNTVSCKYTEKKDYLNSTSNCPNRPLLTKAAQKYIPPLIETMGDLKVKLSLPEQSLLKFKQLKVSKDEPKTVKVTKNNINTSKKVIPKKNKPKFEDVLKSIDEIQFKMQKEKSKKIKKIIPKVVIKKSENGSHYASTTNNDKYNPDLTGRKWQPWVFLEKDLFIDKMALRKKSKAIFNHRKNAFVLAESFKKYKSITNNFIISQPKADDSSNGQLKYTIRFKHTY